MGNAPVALTPRTTTNNNKPTFTWQGVNGAAKYEILVKDISDSGQPVVLNISNIFGLNYTTTKTLAPNKNYRWWVRAISAANIPGPWSQPQDFRVVSTDLPERPDSITPFDIDQLASVVLTTSVENSFNDEVRSITAHPAGTVIQLTPEAAAEHGQEIEFAEPVADIDAVMEEFSLDSFFMETDDMNAVLPAVAVTPVPAVRSETSAEERTTLEAITAGLLAAIAIPRSVPDMEKKRKFRS